MGACVLEAYANDTRTVRVVVHICIAVVGSYMWNNQLDGALHANATYLLHANDDTNLCVNVNDKSDSTLLSSDCKSCCCRYQPVRISQHRVCV